jgi:hypothetical protein
MEVAQASLIDRGNGLLFDNVLNVTWLQDANYAKTSGHSETGSMDWETATSWAAKLNYKGLTGWRLATSTPINGSIETGFNINSPTSELAYMYYFNLNLKGYFSTTGIFQPDYGIFGNGTDGGQNNVGLVKNLQSSAYWLAPESTPDVDRAWYFNTAVGGQDHNASKGNQFYAWAVRPGDVSMVPLPGAIWFFSSGLLGLLGSRSSKSFGELILRL